MAVFGMNVLEFAVIVALVALVVLRLVLRVRRAQELRRQRGDDRRWWEF